MFCYSGIYEYGVRTLRNIWFAMTALAWLSMTMHCQLESVPAFLFLACQPGAPESKTDQHCDTGCCAAEKSQYKSAQLRVTHPSPELLPISFLPQLDLANALPAEVSVGILTAAPPELPTSWQFSSRTALPIRAPSLAS